MKNQTKPFENIKVDSNQEGERWTNYSLLEATYIEVYKKT